MDIRIKYGKPFYSGDVGIVRTSTPLFLIQEKNRAYVDEYGATQRELIETVVKQPYVHLKKNPWVDIPLIEENIPFIENIVNGNGTFKFADSASETLYRTWKQGITKPDSKQNTKKDKDNSSLMFDEIPKNKKLTDMEL